LSKFTLDQAIAYWTFSRVVVLSAKLQLPIIEIVS